MRRRITCRAMTAARCSKVDRAGVVRRIFIIPHGRIVCLRAMTLHASPATTWCHERRCRRARIADRITSALRRGRAHALATEANRDHPAGGTRHPCKARFRPAARLSAIVARQPLERVFRRFAAATHLAHRRALVRFHPRDPPLDIGACLARPAGRRATGTLVLAGERAIERAHVFGRILAARPACAGPPAAVARRVALLAALFGVARLFQRGELGPRDGGAFRRRRVLPLRPPYTVDRPVWQVERCDPFHRRPPL